jgi:DNA-binding CsgD family transcriptional regulator
LLEQARKTAATAAGLVSSDAYSAYVLAYDAARFACIALLAQQGLRATTSGEIAAQLFVGEATVKTHVSRVMTKLGARDRIQAVVLAYENDMA